MIAAAVRRIRALKDGEAAGFLVYGDGTPSDTKSARVMVSRTAADDYRAEAQMVCVDGEWIKWQDLEGSSQIADGRFTLNETRVFIEFFAVVVAGWQE